MSVLAIVQWPRGYFGPGVPRTVLRAEIPARPRASAADCGPPPRLFRNVASRDGLLGCVRELIDGTYGGAVTKRYGYELITASAR
ncbi:hypothetical protein ACGFSB_34740 [Streptomyces sp. NPDC048441]|uniref:hypothetical protein n=1 Tax=Streptomyces sp. NPDC048441 TaxID=3365552 RepID=UPI0037246E9A